MCRGQVLLRSLEAKPEALRKTATLGILGCQVQEPFVPLLLSALQNKLAANLTAAEVKPSAATSLDWLREETCGISKTPQAPRQRMSTL